MGQTESFGGMKNSQSPWCEKGTGKFAENP